MEYCLQLCLLRRDFVFFNRYFNMEFLNKCGSDSLQRLHTGVEELKNWANNSWYASSPLLFCKFPINAINLIIAFSFGYRTIICAFDQRLRVLQKCGESESNPHLIRSISISSDAKTVKLMNQPVNGIVHSAEIRAAPKSSIVHNYHRADNGSLYIILFFFVVVVPVVIVTSTVVNACLAPYLDTIFLFYSVILFYFILLFLVLILFHIVFILWPTIDEVVF